MSEYRYAHILDSNSINKKAILIWDGRYLTTVRHNDRSWMEGFKIGDESNIIDYKKSPYPEIYNYDGSFIKDGRGNIIYNWDGIYLREGNSLSGKIKFHIKEETNFTQDIYLGESSDIIYKYVINADGSFIYQVSKECLYESINIIPVPIYLSILIYLTNPRDNSSITMLNELVPIHKSLRLNVLNPLDSEISLFVIGIDNLSYFNNTLLSFVSSYILIILFDAKLWNDIIADSELRKDKFTYTKFKCWNGSIRHKIHSEKLISEDTLYIGSEYCYNYLHQQLGILHSDSNLNFNKLIKLFSTGLQFLTFKSEWRVDAFGTELHSKYCHVNINVKDTPVKWKITATIVLAIYLMGLFTVLDSVKEGSFRFVKPHLFWFIFSIFTIHIGSLNFSDLRFDERQSFYGYSLILIGLTTLIFNIILYLYFIFM